ncbi:hypothetical protein SLS61_003322 [Didymella pomorum]
MAGGDSDQQMRIIDAAIAAGVRRFMPHEFGHDTLNKGISSRVLKSAGRAKIIEHLQAASKIANFEWVGIATGYTLDTGLISGNMGIDLEWHSATIHGIGTETFAASSLQRVGEVVAHVIDHWPEVANQYIYAAGVLTSANEVLRSAEKATQREFTVGNYDVEECIKEGQARIERGYPDTGMFLLERSILYDEELDARDLTNTMPHPNRRLRIDTRSQPIDPLEQRFSSPSLVPGMGIMSLLSMLLNIEEKSYDQQFSPRRASFPRSNYPRIVITPATESGIAT